MADIVTQCIQDLEGRILGVPELAANGATHVYSIDEFLKKTKHLVFPAAGIYYEGIHSNSQSPTGIGAQLVVSVFFIGASSKFATTVIDKSPVFLALESLRNSIRRARSPTGHPWRYIDEAPHPINKELVAYAQRWGTDVIV